MKKTNKYFKMHTALIITFVTLFLEATTDNVSESFRSDENEIHFLENPDLIDTPESTNLFNCYSTHPIEFHIFLLCLWFASFLYGLCLINWCYDIRQRSVREILFFTCCPFVYYLLFQTLWHRIMNLIRPPANNENHYAGMRTAMNNTPPARETEDYSIELRELRLLRVD